MAPWPHSREPGPSRRCATRRRCRCSRPSQRRRNQGQHLVARVRPARGIAQVEALLDELGQAEMQDQGGGQDQPGISHQAAVSKGDADAVGVVAW